MDVQLPGTETQPAAPALAAADPAPVAAPPHDVDELFPPQAKSVDELFPPEVEKDRYRRQTLGTSPIQDLIFGDTTVNPIARVLDSFGQGAKQGWGAEPGGLSQETTDFLKKAGIFNDYDAGQRSIIKAANESLFRGAAVGVIDPIMRGFPALLHGAQEAVAQTGSELSGTPIDTALKAVNAAPSYLLGSPQVGQGTEILSREFGGGSIEAFPAGLRAPTGIPHPVPHPMLGEIERARSLGVIGAGEEGYQGTRPVEVAPPISGGQETPRASGMPVDLFIDPRTPEAKPADVAPRVPDAAVPEPGLPEAEPTAARPIAEDVTQKLIAAGRPEAEARASGELIASHYEARAERFGGERGTADQLYAAEGPDLRSGDGKAPVRSEPIKPGEGDATPATVIPEKPSSGGAAEAVEPAEPSSSPAVSDAEGLWEDLASQRIARRSKLAVNGGFNGERTRNGAVIRGLATQTWEPGNLVDVGFLKDLLITDKQADGSFKLVSKPDAAGMSRVYESKPHEGISGTAKKVDFVEAAGHLRKPKPEPIKSAPELKKALRGRAGADPQTWSLYEFLAKEGGLKPTDDLKSILGGKNPFVPGFGPLLRPGGLSMDEALTRAKENGYVIDPNDIQHVPGNTNTGENTVSVNHLHDLIDNESRGQKNYRVGHAPEAKVDPAKEANDILAELHGRIEEATGAAQHIDPAIEKRVVEIVRKEGGDVHDAFERAIMEDHDRHEASLNERRATYGEVAGHDFDSGATSRLGEDLAGERGKTWASEQEASEANVRASRDHGEVDRATHELELFQKEQTATPEFKKWFGDSKVVDSEGQPLTVYHGTTADISEFDASKGGSSTGAKSAEKGFFFTSDPDVAGSYAVGHNPYTENPFLRFVNKMTGGQYERFNEALLNKTSGRSAIKSGENIVPAYLSIKNPMEIEFRGKEYRERTFSDLIDEAKASGHDGVVFRNAIDPGFKGGESASDIYVAFDPKQIKSAIGNRGTFDPNSAKIFDQIKRGKINIRKDAKPVITLFKDANASTFIHETGHAWLEELMADSEHSKAPAELKADAIKVLDWLGVDSADKIKTSHHEKFARGFERYMMEGKAPNQALANVFAKFKNWLTKIYQTVTRLKSPINDEIRGVFDRLLTMHPSEVKIEPEGPPKTFADIHEIDAAHTAPEAAHPVAETIQAERDMLANEHIPEEHDARLDGVTSEAGRREAGGPQPLRDGNEAARSEEAGNDQATGEVGEGGSVAPSESARPSVGAGKIEVSPDGTFAKVETPLIDKAGNIRLENINTPEDVLQVLRDSADRNNGFMSERRGVVSDAQALSLADAMGMDVAYLNTKRIGEAWNKEEIFALENMLVKSANAVYEAMNGTDVLAYADAKARLLMIHDLVQGKASAARAEAGRALQAFAALKKMKGSAEAHDLANLIKEKGGDLTLFQLEREMKLGSQYSTPAQVSKFVNETMKPTWQQMVVEGWMAFLLSGIKTHMANIMGNTISGLWRPLETATAATIGKARSVVTGSQDRVLFGEAAAELFGMVHGSKEGIVAAYKAYKSEEPQMTGARQTEQAHPKAIPSATVNVLGREIEIGGKQIRIPLRLLGAEDEFFKSVAFRGDINRQAYALAAKENLPPEQFNMRVAELSMNPTEEMVANAKGVADYQTFQTPLGKVGRSVQNFANSHILAKLVVPFVRTPINLLKYAGERTPLGLFAQEVRDNLSGKNGAVARDTQVARITLGTMVGVAAFEMASQGLITGGGPADPKKRAIMQADGWQDYSVRVGDMYYRYNRLDPFSVILGVVADAYEIQHTLGSDHLDKEHLPTLVFGAISKNILNRASLQGISDIIQAVNDPERYGKNYIKGLVGTVVPALSAQSAQTMDPIVRETRTILDGLKARIPGMSQDLMAKRDIWGEPVTRDGGLGPDIASPIMERRIKNDPVNQALIAANYFPGKLERKIRGVDLTDQQYDDFQRIAGRMAKVRLNAIVSIPGFAQMPTTTRTELMTNAITTSREAARSLIMMQNPEIIKKATDAKMAKQRGEPAH